MFGTDSPFASERMTPAYLESVVPLPEAIAPPPAGAATRSATWSTSSCGRCGRRDRLRLSGADPRQSCTATRSGWCSAPPPRRYRRHARRHTLSDVPPHPAPGAADALVTLQAAEINDGARQRIAGRQTQTS